MKEYFPVGLDNRGMPGQPFGFVYLSRISHEDDGSGRIGYGANRDNPHPLAVWVCRETPNDITAETIKRVKEFLAEQFPDLAKTPDKVSGKISLPE